MLRLTVNGAQQAVNADVEKPLLWVLRDDLQLTGTKYGCGRALCGACTVHLDGQPTRSCVTPAGNIGARSITTIEAIGQTDIGERVQRAWLELNVPQCGFCQSGQIMAVTALLSHNPRPTDTDIDQALSGNLCRCGTYPRIRAAIHRIAGALAA